MADDILAKEGADAPHLDTISYYDKTEPRGDDWIYFLRIEEKRGSSRHSHRWQQNGQVVGRAGVSRVLPVPGALGVNNDLGDERADTVSKSGRRVVLSGLGGDEFMGGIPDPRALLGDLIVQGRFFRFAGQLAAWSLIKRRPWIHLLWDSVADGLPAVLAQYLVRKQSSRPGIGGILPGAPASSIGRLAASETFGFWLPTRRSVVGGVQAMANNLAKMPAPMPALEEATYPYLDQTSD